MDEEYLKLKTTSIFHLSFLNDSLTDLNANLIEKFNTKLNFYKGNTIEILNYLTDKHRINKVYSHKIFKGKYFNSLDRKVGSLLVEKSINWVEKNQFGIQLDNRVQVNGQITGINLSEPVSQKIEAENFIEDDSGNLDLSLGRVSCQRGGESNAHKYLKTFLTERHKNYSKKMSSPLTAEDSCSRLSPHLCFGTISIKYIVKNIEKS